MELARQVALRLAITAMFGAFALIALLILVPGFPPRL